MLPPAWLYEVNRRHYVLSEPANILMDISEESTYFNSYLTFAMQFSRPPVCEHGMFYFVYTCCDFIASILFAVYRCNYCMALTVIILMLPYSRLQLTQRCFSNEVYSFT